MISESRLWKLEGGPAIGAEKGGENEKKNGVWRPQGTSA